MATPATQVTITEQVTDVTVNNTNAITVDWGGVSGLFPNAVEVIETNATNCPGTPVLLDVFVVLIIMG